RAVAGRDLTGVPRENVQPEDRDEIDRDPRRDSLVIAADLEREHREDDGRRGDDDKPGRREDPHTRRTCLRPKRPFGLISRMIRSTPNAIGSRSSEVAKPTYCPIKFRNTPSRRPPTIEPAGLSSPPSTAAANAYSRIACIIVG